MHNQDQDGDFALFWTSVGTQESLLFLAEVNTDVYVYKVTEILHYFEPP